MSSSTTFNDLAVRADRAPSLRRQEPSWPVLCFGLDLVMLAAALVSVTIGAHAAGLSNPSAGWLVGFGLVVVASLAAGGMYEPRLRLQTADDLRSIAASTALAAMGFAMSGVVFAPDPEVAAESVRLWTFATVYLAAGRVGLLYAQAQARRAGGAGRPTLIIGAGRVGALTAQRLGEQPSLGLRPIGFLDKDPRPSEGARTRLPVLGASWDLETVVAAHGVEHAVLAFSTAPHSVMLDLVGRCEKLGVSVSLVPRLFERMPRRLAVEHLGGLPLMTLAPANPRGWQFTLKYAVDRVVAAFGLILLLPVLGLVSVAVRASLGSPIFFRQLRVGRDGRHFEIVKFRSMKPPLASDPGAAVGAEEAHRCTRMGAFLRRTSLDELPQLLNVLRGEMSLVGPRPERPELTEVFDQTVHRYPERGRVKAGVTGWAQVHGLGRGPDRFGDVSLAERAEWDNYYIENWSLWLDVKILCLTALAVFRWRQVE